LTDEGEKRGDFDPGTNQNPDYDEWFLDSAQLGFANVKTRRRQTKEPEVACLNWTRDISNFSTSISQVIL
jgi:hypothetical protein